MVRLRQAVFDADKNNQNVEPALSKLRQYVYAHMNTDLNGGNDAIKLPIQLTYSYDRAVVAEKDRVVKTNASVATDAQKYCEEKLSHGFLGATRVACIEQYTAEHGVKENPILIEYYTFNFVSPTWTFDLAGWSIIFSVLLLIATIALFISRSARKRSHRT
jgi:hypothetical protein